MPNPFQPGLWGPHGFLGLILKITNKMPLFFPAAFKPACSNPLIPHLLSIYLVLQGKYFMVRDIYGKLDVLNTTGSCGAPNFRQAKGGYAVFGMGQPSLSGFKLVLQKLQREGHKVSVRVENGIEKGRRAFRQPLPLFAGVRLLLCPRGARGLPAVGGGLCVLHPPGQGEPS